MWKITLIGFTGHHFYIHFCNLEHPNIHRKSTAINHEPQMFEYNDDIFLSNKFKCIWGPEAKGRGRLFHFVTFFSFPLFMFIQKKKYFSFKPSC